MTNTDTKRFPTDIFEYPEEIADTFINLINEDIEDKDNYRTALIDGIYYVRTCAENSFNFDYFRVLYNTMAKIAEKYSV